MYPRICIPKVTKYCRRIKSHIRNVEATKTANENTHPYQRRLNDGDIQRQRFLVCCERNNVTRRNSTTLYDTLRRCCCQRKPTNIFEIIMNFGALKLRCRIRSGCRQMTPLEYLRYNYELNNTRESLYTLT